MVGRPPLRPAHDLSKIRAECRSYTRGIDTMREGIDTIVETEIPGLGVSIPMFGGSIPGLLFRLFRSFSYALPSQATSDPY